jgi:hypothetical protein
MKYNAATRYILITLCALALGACSGSGPGNQLGVGPHGSEGPVSLTITSPAVGDEMETPDDSVVLEGTADSDNEIVSVSWVSNRGGQGEASGSTTWTTAGIPLQPGENSITITAEDSSGATATRTVVIVRESEGTGSVTLSWTAPTTREDGTPLTDLAGFRIQYGRMSGIYDYEIRIDNPGVLTYVVEGLQPGTWYFVLSAFDSSGIESNFSNEVEKEVE